MITIDHECLIVSFIFLINIDRRCDFTVNKDKISLICSAAVKITWIGNILPYIYSCPVAIYCNTYKKYNKIGKAKKKPNSHLKWLIRESLL